MSLKVKLGTKCVPFVTTAIEPPTAYLWTLYFLAQHYDKQRKTDLALKTIDAAIQHTPTLVELYMTKGRILKVGDTGSLSKLWLLHHFLFTCGTIARRRLGSSRTPNE